MRHIQNTNYHTGKLDAFSSAGTMLGALCRSQTSAVELLELHLQRIEHYNSVLNAIVIHNYDRARRVAAQADAARTRGEDKLLLGLPLTIKDCIDVKGLPTTGGLRERVDAVSEADAPIVDRVRASGGVIMGKTNVPPYAGDWQSTNPLFGRTNNPWDVQHTPGGSTGGGAAAVAAGLTPLEFGSDAAGSIRVPAAFCGIYGHKPSQAAVPSRGHFPGSNVVRAIPGMVVQGPLARCAEDLELALDVIAGADVDRNVAWRLDLPAARHGHLSDFRVAVLPPIEWLPVDAEIVTALDELATELGRLGTRVQVIQPEVFGDLCDYFSIYVSILAAGSTMGRPREACLEEAETERRHATTFDALAWADGLEASASDYVLWYERRDWYRAALRDFFTQWDVLLSPVNFVNAFVHTDEPRHKRWFDVNGKRVTRYGWQAVYASLANLSGHPATAFPVGQTQSGLPIGLQAIGPDLEDRTPIRFSALVAREFGGYSRPPGYE